jgi:fatty acid synthase
MQAQADALWALLHPGTALVFVPLIPAAYVIFGIFLSATMCAAKWTILGRAKLGVHR